MLFTCVRILCLLLFCVSLHARADDQAAANQFEDWLKSNQSQPIPPQPQSQPTAKTPPKAMTYQDMQEAMLRAAPPSPVPVSDDEQAAFSGFLQKNMPLSPQQVVRLHQAIDASQRAAAMPATLPPRPVSSTLMLNLAPGVTPPAIRLAQGYITTLMFVDSTGMPWPIAAYDNGDPKLTNIQWDGKSNVILIQAQVAYGDTDFVVRLTGLDTPVTLSLVLGQPVVDYRTDIHVAGFGPNAKAMPTGTELPGSANQVLLNVLDGIAPTGATLLSVKGGDCQAWASGDKMYLRTRLTLLSPGWVGKMASPDGMNAYEIPKSSSIVVSRYGNPISLRVEGL